MKDIPGAQHIIPLEYISHYTPFDGGGSIYIMEKTGIAMARIYWYDDTPDIIYLCALSVNIDQRHKKIGTQLQEIRERIGRMFGAKFSKLWVTQDSWMMEWYIRRGYKMDSIFEDEIDTIWMIKDL